MDDIIKYLPWAILALILLAVIFLRAKLIIIVNGDLIIRLRVLFLSFTIIGKKRKKRPSKRRYSKKAIEKRQKKALRSLKKRRSLHLFKGSEKESKGKLKFKFPNDIEKALDLLASLFSDLLLPVIANARVRFKYFRVTVASDDPASTAIRYGVVSQGVAYLLQVLCESTKISDRQLTKVVIEPDFLAEKSSFSLHMTASFGVWKLIATALSGGLKVFKRLSAFRGTPTTQQKNDNK